LITEDRLIRRIGAGGARDGLVTHLSSYGGVLLAVNSDLRDTSAPPPEAIEALAAAVCDAVAKDASGHGLTTVSQSPAGPALRAYVDDHAVRAVMGHDRRANRGTVQVGCPANGEIGGDGRLMPLFVAHPPCDGGPSSC
jgi:hypothetical protein